MATVKVTSSQTPAVPALVATWTPLLNGDVGDSFSCAPYTDKSVQVFGTFGSASLALQGSNDGTNWVALSDPQGITIAITSTGIKMVSEATVYIRPSVTGGGGTTSLTCLTMVKS